MEESIKMILEAIKEKVTDLENANELIEAQENQITALY